MKISMKTATLMCVIWACLFCSPALQAQQCQDEEGITKDYLKDLNDRVETTRKESLADFEKGYHQKSSLTKLSITLGMVKELVECLEKAGQDPAAPKDQADANKTKQEMYSKVAEKLAADQKALKAAEDSKAAKVLIEKFDYSSK
ncbi:MAG TPA: hypothetical protein VKV95_00690 [Terriglobia bacterium]|nr:hypothetical protein [Terriglobia bacterium]